LSAQDLIRWQAHEANETTKRKDIVMNFIAIAIQLEIEKQNELICLVP
jgi:hypothetical protein